MATAKKVREVLDEVEHAVDRIAGIWGKLRGDELGDDDQAEAESERDDLLAEILDESEEAQALLAASLGYRVAKVAEKINDGDDEATALGAVILRALAAHSQAEAVRGLMESPDVSQFVNITDDDDADDDDGQGGDDD